MGSVQDNVLQLSLENYETVYKMSITFTLPYHNLIKNLKMTKLCMKNPFYNLLFLSLNYLKSPLATMLSITC